VAFIKNLVYRFPKFLCSALSDSILSLLDRQQKEVNFKALWRLLRRIKMIIWCQPLRLTVYGIRMAAARFLGVFVDYLVYDQGDTLLLLRLKLLKCCWL